MYEAGKAVKKGISNHYAPTLYAPSMYAQPAYGGPMQPSIPMLPLPNGAGPPPPHSGYGRDYDGASSGENYCQRSSIIQRTSLTENPSFLKSYFENSWILVKMCSVLSVQLDTAPRCLCCMSRVVEGTTVSTNTATYSWLWYLHEWDILC